MVRPSTGAARPRSVKGNGPRQRRTHHSDGAAVTPQLPAANGNRPAPDAMALVQILVEIRDMLRRLLEDSATRNRKVLTLDEAADRCRLSKVTFLKRVAEKLLPAPLEGLNKRRKMWDRDVLDRAIERLGGTGGRTGDYIMDLIHAAQDKQPAQKG